MSSCSQECRRHSLHAGDGRVSVRRRRQAGDVSERVPGQRGLQQRRLHQGVRARRGLHPQAAGQDPRVSADATPDFVFTLEWKFKSLVRWCVFVYRDRPSAAECLSHPWLWQLCLSPDAVTTRPVRERSSGTKWAAPPEDPEDKENFLESPHVKRFRFEEERPAAGDATDFWWGQTKAIGGVRQRCHVFPLSFYFFKPSEIQQTAAHHSQVVVCH